MSVNVSLPPSHRPVPPCRRNTFQQEYKDAAAELCDLNAGQRALVGEALQFAQEALTRDRLAAKQVYRKASEDSAAARSRTAKKGTPSRGGSSAFLSTGAAMPPADSCQWLELPLHLSPSLSLPSP